MRPLVAPSARQLSPRGRSGRPRYSRFVHQSPFCYTHYLSCYSSCANRNEQWASGRSRVACPGRYGRTLAIVGWAPLVLSSSTLPPCPCRVGVLKIVLLLVHQVPSGRVCSFCSSGSWRISCDLAAVRCCDLHLCSLRVCSLLSLHPLPFHRCVRAVLRPFHRPLPQQCGNDIGSDGGGHQPTRHCRGGQDAAGRAGGTGAASAAAVSGAGGPAWLCRAAVPDPASQRAHHAKGDARTGRRPR